MLVLIKSCSASWLREERRSIYTNSKGNDPNALFEEEREKTGRTENFRKREEVL